MSTFETALQGVDKTLNQFLQQLTNIENFTPLKIHSQNQFELELNAERTPHLFSIYGNKAAGNAASLILKIQPGYFSIESVRHAVSDLISSKLSHHSRDPSCQDARTAMNEIESELKTLAAHFSDFSSETLEIVNNCFSHAIEIYEKEGNIRQYELDKEFENALSSSELSKNLTSSIEKNNKKVIPDFFDDGVFYAEDKDFLKPKPQGFKGNQSFSWNLISQEGILKISESLNTGLEKIIEDTEKLFEINPNRIMRCSAQRATSTLENLCQGSAGELMQGACDFLTILQAMHKKETISLDKIAHMNLKITKDLQKEIAYIADESVNFWIKQAPKLTTSDKKKSYVALLDELSKFVFAFSKQLGVFQCMDEKSFASFKKLLLKIYSKLQVLKKNIAEIESSESIREYFGNRVGIENKKLELKKELVSIIEDCPLLTCFCLGLLDFDTGYFSANTEISSQKIPTIRLGDVTLAAGISNKLFN